MLVPVLLFIVGLLFLIKGGDWFVDGATGIAHKFHVPDLLIGATVVSIGTTLPEVMVSTMSAVSGHGEIAYGNAIGSVICNSALIAAITIAVRPGKVDPKTLKTPVIFFFIAAAIYCVAAYAMGEFTRPLGFVMLAMFVAYMVANVLQMKKAPAAAEAEAEYLLQFGIRIIDQKDIPGRVLWECEANELLEDSYRLDEYARVHVPLMCMQYPYTKYGRNVPFKVSKKTYNYTGISYDIDKLDQVVDVDRNSPAYAAGIRPRDIIEKIGRHKMDHSAEEFSSAYKRFITNTMQYRDPKTMFTDANGFKYCMFWDVFKYPQIADASQSSDYLPAFSYLYYFAPYINPSGNNACTFNIKRGKTKLEVIIRPTIRSEVTVEIK